MIKILYGYPYYPSNVYRDVETINLEYLARLSSFGYSITPVCFTIDPPNSNLPFSTLDRAWREGDKKLFQLYEKIARLAEDHDVLFNSAGINLHPEFVASLPCRTVFQCFDDPESSPSLSDPVAAYYDMCLVGNIAELGRYRKNGAKRVHWVPLGLTPDIYDSTKSEAEIFGGTRDIGLFMMLDKTSPWRAARMEVIDRAFPGEHFYGSGWARGILPSDRQMEFLARSRIGINMHNSTGPINFRTFYLPANGVMQICDNKSTLGGVYEVGKEVAGYETVEECIDLCRYYLAHEDERQAMAIAGYRRAMKDYTEEAIFRRVHGLLEELCAEPPRQPKVLSLTLTRSWGRWRVWKQKISSLAQRAVSKGLKVLRVKK